MTNFEKWKQELTVENTLPVFKKTGCVGCPAEEVCMATKGCERAFRKWARGKVKNDG